MKRIQIWMMGLTTLALAAACDGARTTGPTLRPGEPSLDISVDLGAVEALVTYNGTRLNEWTTGCGAFTFELTNPLTGQLYFMSPSCFGSGPDHPQAGRARASDLPVGTYSMRLRYSHAFMPGPDVGDPVEVRVSAGQTFDAGTFEVGGHVGQLRGKVLVNGEATCCLSVSVTVEAPSFLAVGTQVQWWVTPPGPPPGAPESGTFLMLLPATGVSGLIRNMTGTLLANFSTGIIAGQTADVGLIAVNTGAVEALVTYKGTPLNEWTTGCGALAFELRDVNGQTFPMGLSCFGSGPDNPQVGRARASDLPVGTYTLRLHYGHPGMPGPELGDPVEVLVRPGETRDAGRFEIGTKLGQLHGRVLVNGEAPPRCLSVTIHVGGPPPIVVSSQVQSWVTPPGPPPGAPESGTFLVLLPPGDVTGVVRNMVGTQLATFSATIVAGEQFSVTSDLDARTGAVEALVTYKDTPLNDWTTGCGIFAFELRNSSGQTFPMGVNCFGLGPEHAQAGRARASDVPVGTYTLTLRYGHFAMPGPELGGPVEVQVTSGGTFDAGRFEVADDVGQLRGKVLVNGEPTCCLSVSVRLADPPFTVVSTQVQWWVTPPGPPPGAPDAGTFLMLLPPGAVTGAVRNMIGTELATFAATIAAGRTTDVGNPLNSPPHADAGGPYGGTEGTAIAFDGSRSTDPEGQALTFKWTFGDGTLPVFGATPSHVFADDGRYMVTLEVTDPAGASQTATIEVVVGNVSPVVAQLRGATLIQGETYTEAGSFTDAGADSWTGTVDYGDGTGAEPVALTGNVFHLNRTYRSAGRFAVTVTITDDDNGAGTRTANVVVLTPLQALQALANAVSELRRSLTSAESARLSAMIKAALLNIARGNTSAARSHLQAFIGEIEALVAAQRLTPESGATLIDAARRILRRLP